jgi:hypothetical protein
VATRGSFEDRALESRFLTEEMGQHRLRDDVPINLPQSHKAEALSLRNKLLMFRFRNLHKPRITEHLVDRTIEPRLNQIFAPLLSIIEDGTARDALKDVARQYHREMVSERGMDTEAQILEVIQSLLRSAETGPLTLADITSRFVDLNGDQYQWKITNKWVGGVIRKRLHLRTQKSHGIFMLPETEWPKLEALYAKYGVEAADSESAPPAPLAGEPPPAGG